MHEGSDLFRAIVESTTDGIWIFDQAGRTTYANAQLAAMLGRTVEEMAETTVFDTLDDLGHEQLRAHLRELEDADAGADNVECSLLRKDGTRIWALISHSVLRDADGTPAGWMHRVTEYTDRKLLLERLQTSEHKLAQAQRIARVGSWDWDVAADVVSWSDELYRTFNLRPQEFQATYAGFMAFVHPEDRDLVETAVASVFTGQDEFEFEARIIRKGGGVAWIDGRGKAERSADGTPVRMSGTTQDITESRRAELALAESSARFRLLQAMASAANEATTLREALEVAAVELARHTGWRPCGVYEVAGPRGLQPMELEGVRTADPDPGALAVAQRALLTRRTAWDATSTVTCGPDRSRPQPEHGRIGIPVLLEREVVCVVELVTEADLQPTPELLALIEEVTSQLSRVAERERAAAELAAARDAAMEASRLKSEFLATMSHEIRTPLHGVIGLNDLLLRTELDPQQRRFAEGVQSAGRTLLGLINDILDLSKIEAGELQLEAVTFDPRAVFEQTAGLLAEPARAKGIELVVACHPGVPPLLVGDPVRLGQVLANLGSNAVKFTETGEVVVHAAVAADAGDAVTLTVEVTDTGIGIPEEAMGRLFDAFSQADASTTRRYGGTGLGLAISRQLVHALGGEIEVHSEVGVGSTFRFTARFSKPTSTAVPAPPPVTRHRLDGVRTLIVDDNATNRLILAEQLSGWQMPAEEADGAEAARAALERASAAGTPFELVLLDMCMPGTHGLDLATWIRAQAGLGDPRIVLLSSSHDLDRAALDRARLDDVLSKPLLHSRLYDSLVQVMGLGPQEPLGSPVVPTPLEAGGKTVLVVEDNPVNQMVATGILENLGYPVEVVGDGLQAVDALTRRGAGGYAAVLMDCQMPHMDGYDATRAIRLEEAGGTRLPIIAMTASAIEGERERCLAAGMDDFLTKPIDPATLADALHRWIDGRSATGAASAGADGAAAQGSGSGAPDAGTSPVLDEDRLKMLAELGDGALLKRFVASFVSAAPESEESIRRAVRAGDPPALVQAAHRLKGSAQNLGVPAVGAVCLELELLGDRGVTDGAEALLDRLSVELDRALAALHEVAGTGG